MLEDPGNINAMSDEVMEKMKDIKDRHTPIEEKQKRFIEIINEAAENHVTPEKQRQEKRIYLGGDMRKNP